MVIGLIEISCILSTLAMTEVSHFLLSGFFDVESLVVAAISTKSKDIFKVLILPTTTTMSTLKAIGNFGRIVFSLYKFHQHIHSLPSNPCLALMIICLVVGTSHWSL